MAKDQCGCETPLFLPRRIGGLLRLAKVPQVIGTSSVDDAPCGGGTAHLDGTTGGRLQSAVDLLTHDDCSLLGDGISSSTVPFQSQADRVKDSAMNAGVDLNPVQPTVSLSQLRKREREADEGIRIVLCEAALVRR